MFQIFLIRPGATEFDVQGRIQGNLDVPLSTDGQREVAGISEQLRGHKLAALYCSDCLSAKATAESLAAGLGLKVKVLDRLENLDYGLWQGQLVDEVRRKQPTVYRQWQEHPEQIRPPEGETIAEAAQRCSEALKRIKAKHKQGVVGLVLPEPLASVFRCRLGCGQAGDLWDALSAHGQCELLEESPRSPAHSS